MVTTGPGPKTVERHPTAGGTTAQQSTSAHSPPPTPQPVSPPPAPRPVSLPSTPQPRTSIRVNRPQAAGVPINPPCSLPPTTPHVAPSTSKVKNNAMVASRPFKDIENSDSSESSDEEIWKVKGNGKGKGKGKGKEPACRMQRQKQASDDEGQTLTQVKAKVHILVTVCTGKLYDPTCKSCQQLGRIWEMVTTGGACALCKLKKHRCEYSLAKSRRRVSTVNVVDSEDDSDAKAPLAPPPTPKACSRPKRVVAPRSRPPR